MSAMNDWDEELAVIAKEVHMVTSDQMRAKISRNKGLIARKMATIQSQIKIEKMLRRIKGFCEREFLLLPKEKALLHWSKTLHEKIGQYYALKQKNMTKSLWINLIRTRIVGPLQSTTVSFDSDDLLTLSIRHANLLKTEKLLGETLVKKGAHRKDAISRYEQLAIAHANRQSATTMQARLGTNLSHALRNPVMQSIGRSVVQLSASIHNPVHQNQTQTLENRLHRRSSSVLDFCRSYTISSKNDPHWQPSPKVMGRAENAVKKLNDLERTIQDSLSEINPANVPLSRPKFVHNPSKKDKTVSPR